MKPNKKYQDWHSIFLDTCTIIDYMKATSGSNDKRLNFVKFVLDDLSSSENKKRKRFVISAISISELILIQSNDELKEKIFSLFGASNVEVVSWNRSLALYSNYYCRDLLSKKALNELSNFTIPSVENKKLAREFLIKDYMLVASASYVKCDVILTSDINTFIPVATKLQFPAIGLVEENFKISPNGESIVGFL